MIHCSLPLRPNSMTKLRLGDAAAWIPWAMPQLNGNEKQYMIEALESTWVSDGPYVKKFQNDFLKIHNAQNGFAVNNGTTALQLAYLAAGIKLGDEVIVPNFSFVAPGNMVIAIGATPIFADVDKSTWCLDVNSVESLINKKTKAIVAVHTYGNVCEMNALRELAKIHNLVLIEDAAEAIFSKYYGEMTGTLGDIAAFSFQATKTITMGEGGFVMFKNPDLASSIAMLRSHGMSAKRYWHESIGYNFRVPNTVAAIGVAQLEKAEMFIQARSELYKMYVKRLSGENGISLQQWGSGVEPVVWALAVKIEASAFLKTRDEIIEIMKENGVDTRPGFYCYSEQPIYCKWTNGHEFPNSLGISQNVISLPFYVGLTEENVDYICHHFLKLRK